MLVALQQANDKILCELLLGITKMAIIACTGHFVISELWDGISFNLLILILSCSSLISKWRVYALMEPLIFSKRGSSLNLNFCASTMS